MSTAISTIKNNLTPREIELINSLPPAVNEYVWLRQERPISALNILEWKNYSLMIVTKANLDLPPGQNILVDQRYLEAQALQLRNEFEGPGRKANKYSQMTVGEVVEAFHRGARQEAGTVMRWNPSTFHMIIRWFFELPERQGAWVRYMELLENAEKAKELTLEEKLRRSKLSLIKLFHQYRDTQDLGEQPWYYYGALADIIGTKVEYAAGKTYKTLFTDPKAKAEISSQAEKEYQELITVEQMEDDGINSKVKPIAGFMKNVILRRMGKDDALANKMKEVALRRYFDDLIRENKDLLL